MQRAKPDLDVGHRSRPVVGRQLPDRRPHGRSRPQRPGARLGHRLRRRPRRRADHRQQRQRSGADDLHPAEQLQGGPDRLEAVQRLNNPAHLRPELIVPELTFLVMSSLSISDGM